MKPIHIIALLTLTSVAFASSTLDFASKDVARDLSPKLAGRTVAVFDLRDQQKNIRELGRIFADQYLRIDLSKSNIKVVTRNQIDQLSKDTQLSQSELVDAVLSGKKLNLKGIDTFITGSLSLIGDRYTVTAEAIDANTGVVVETGRADFPQTPSLEKLWENVIEGTKTAPTTTPNTSPKGAYGINNLPETASLEKTAYGSGFGYLGCYRTENSTKVTCAIKLTAGTDVFWYVDGNDQFFMLDGQGRQFFTNKCYFNLPNTEPTNKKSLFAGIPVRVDCEFDIQQDLNDLIFFSFSGIRFQPIKITVSNP
jgi:TolB-like protein